MSYQGGDRGQQSSPAWGLWPTVLSCQLWIAVQVGFMKLIHLHLPQGTVQPLCLGHLCSAAAVERTAVSCMWGCQLHMRVSVRSGVAAQKEAFPPSPAEQIDLLARNTELLSQTCDSMGSMDQTAAIIFIHLQATVMEKLVVGTR